VAIKLFKTIQPDSFAIYLWGKKDPKLQEEMTRNLNKFIDRFNKVGFWVATEICQVTNLKDRVVVMERFIQIAKVPPLFHRILLKKKKKFFFALPCRTCTSFKTSTT